MSRRRATVRYLEVVRWRDEMWEVVRVRVGRLGGWPFSGSEGRGSSDFAKRGFVVLRVCGISVSAGKAKEDREILPRVNRRRGR